MSTDNCTRNDPELELLDVADTWWDDASCNTGGGGLSAMFFSEELGDIARAKRICATCPVIEPCLAGAIERREPWGVWGGQLFLNGRVLASKRAKGRPPSVPRPEDDLPDVPIPARLANRVAHHRPSVA